MVEYRREWHFSKTFITLSTLHLNVKHIKYMRHIFEDITILEKTDFSLVKISKIFLRLKISLLPVKFGFKARTRKT